MIKVFRGVPQSLQEYKDQNFARAMTVFFQMLSNSPLAIMIQFDAVLSGRATDSVVDVTRTKIKIRTF
jgi:hypothetical protein